MARYFEDVEVGDSDSFGNYEVTEEEIVEFAEQYDPQPFHVDPEAAAESMFGGLIASGWHTSAMTMRMLVDHHLEDVQSLGALGVDDLRWRNPVRPGDVLSVETEVVDRELWNEIAGLVYTDTRVHDGDDETKLTLTSLGLVARRE